MSTICLLSTLHDPGGKLGPFIEKCFDGICSLYDDVLVVVTGTTHGDDLAYLNGHAIVEPANGMANGRRRVLRAGLDRDVDYFHYCDLDRILYWYMHEQTELESIVKLLSKQEYFVILGRSYYALNSHPHFQLQTEMLASELAGFCLQLQMEVGVSARPVNWDMLSGSRGIPRRLGYEIVEKSKAENGAALDVEWPMIVGRNNLKYFEVHGLAYEHSFLGIEKPYESEIRERINNLQAIAEIILNHEDIRP